VLTLSYPLCKIGRRLHVPSDVVWDVITDTTRWPEWGPSVSAVDCRERYVRKGIRGRVRLPFSMWVPFAITEYEDRRYWAWNIWGVRATGHRIEPLGDGSCLLIFEVPFFAAPYLFICWLAIRRIASLLEEDP